MQYAFEVYATSANGATSGTNRLVFHYQPGGAALKPWICSITVGNGVVRLTLTNLTAGATHRVERSLDLGQTNHWTTVTNLVAAGSQSEISDPANPAWKSAFYRVCKSP
jgi:hypothetical protein